MNSVHVCIGVFREKIVVRAAVDVVEFVRKGFLEALKRVPNHHRFHRHVKFVEKIDLSISIVDLDKHRFDQLVRNIQFQLRIGLKKGFCLNDVWNIVCCGFKIISLRFFAAFFNEQK